MKIQVQWVGFAMLASLLSVVSAPLASAQDSSQALGDEISIDWLSQLSQQPPEAESEESEDGEEDEEDEDEEAEAAEESGPLRIIVTATRTEENVLDVPRSVTVIDRETIEDQQLLTSELADILGKLVPGLAPPTFNGNTAGLLLRGRPITVFIDGVPQTPNANTSSVDLNVIDPSLIEQIEVLRGPSAVFGDGGTGGVINIITRKPTEDTINYELDFRLGTSLTQIEDQSFFYSGRIGVAASDGKADGRIDFSYDVTQSRFGADGDLLVPTSISDTDQLGLLLKTGYNFDDDERVELTYNFFRDVQNSDFITDQAVTANFIPLETAVPLEVGDLDFEEAPVAVNNVVNLTYRNGDILGSDLNLQLYFRDRDVTQTFVDFRENGLNAVPLFDPFPDIFQTTLDSREFGGRLQLDTPIGSSAGLLWGVDYADEFNSRPVLSIDTVAFDEDQELNVLDDTQSQGSDFNLRSVAVFAQGTWDISDQWQLSGGVRYENFDVSADPTELAFVATTALPADRPGGDTNSDDVVFNAGLIYRPIPEIGIFTSFAQGFSLPDISIALDDPFEIIDVNSTQLDPQRVDNFELGLRTDFKRVQASVTGFFNRSEFGSALSPGPDGFLILERAPQRNFGVEATVDWQPDSAWRLGSSFTWNDGESDVDDDGEFVALSSLEISPFKLGFYVENDTAPGWTNRLDLLAIGNRVRAFNAGVDDTPIDGYITLDFFSRVKLGQGAFTVGVSNLLNSDFLPVFSQASTGFLETQRVPAPGRAITLGYSVDF